MATDLTLLTLLLTIAPLAFVEAGLFSSPTPNCECSQLKSCQLCTPAIKGPCHDLGCNWCVPTLSCQNPTAACDSTDPKAATKIGHDYSCQVNGNEPNGPNGPSIMTARINVLGKEHQLWDGGASPPSPPFTLPVAGDSSGSITLQGMNWGESNFSANQNQAVRVCPFTGSKSSPDPRTCFGNCTVSSTDIQPVDCGLSESNIKCSTIKCNGVPAGIGATMAVFLEVYGELASVPATQAVVFPDDWATNPHTFVPYEPPVVSDVSGPSCPKPDDCQVAYGDNLTLTGTGFPFSQSVIDTFKFGAADPTQALSASIGGMPCLNTVFLSSTQIKCTVPLNSGFDLDLKVTVGGQQGTWNGRVHYHPPLIASVSPHVVPSYGNTDITIAGEYFDTFGNGYVYFSPGTGKALVCPAANWTQKKIICHVDASGSTSQVIEHVVVSTNHATSNMTSNTSTFTFKKCVFSESAGGLCTQDGMQQCDTNYQCQHDGIVETEENAMCNYASAQCVCLTKTCKNGGKFEPSTCSCQCLNGYGDAGHGGEEISGTVNKMAQPGHYSGFCADCPASCGALDKKVTTDSKCGCEFNYLHIIWIVLLVLIVAAAVGFGVYKYKQSKYKALPLLAADGVDYYKPEDDEPSESQPNVSGEYM